MVVFDEVKVSMPIMKGDESEDMALDIDKLDTEFTKTFPIKHTSFY